MNDPEAKAQQPQSEQEPLLGAYETDGEPSEPVFVEVITEEAVEYLAPETPISTGDLIPQPQPGNDTPSGGVDTMPYPTLTDESGADAELAPDPISEETEDSRPIPRPFGTTAPIIPRPGRDDRDS